MDNLAELLPEGLTEHAVEEIAQLVNSVITEKVNEEVDGLITKVNAFLRMKVDEIKDYALEELAQDDETVRNARLYESMKSMLSIDIENEDKQSAIHQLSEENTQAQENISTLTSELEKLMEENDKLLSISEAFKSQIETLEKEKSELVEEAKNLVESQQLPFESSEKAVMVSNVEDGPVAAEKGEIQDINEFLTPEVMRFMPIAE